MNSYKKNADFKMYWLIGIISVFIVALVIIKLSIDTKKNPESNLGILEHPSTYSKQPIEMVDKQIKHEEDKDSLDEDTVKLKI